MHPLSFHRRYGLETEVTDLAATAREIIDGSMYMVLGTADQGGSPWVSPVYFAVSDYKDFYWVSLPAAQHSQNLELRPDVSVVVFDSRAPRNRGLLAPRPGARRPPLDGG